MIIGTTFINIGAIIGFIGIILIMILVIKLITFWFRSLVSVMATSDKQLPSQYDKILWVTLFIFVPLFAPFIYTASVEKYNKKQV